MEDSLDLINFNSNSEFITFKVEENSTLNSEGASQAIYPVIIKGNSHLMTQADYRLCLGHTVVFRVAPYSILGLFDYSVNVSRMNEGKM